MKRVIIESPYAGNVERNLRYARAALADCLRRGEAPFASHALYTQPGVLNDAKPEERAKGIAAGHAWIGIADAVVVYTDYGISDGMALGIKRAHDNPEMDVVYRRIPDFVEAERARQANKALIDSISRHGREIVNSYMLAAAHIIPSLVIPDPESVDCERKVTRREIYKLTIAWDGKFFTEDSPVREILEAMSAICSSLQQAVNAKHTAEANSTHLETRLRLAGEALDLKIARIEELRTENEGLHDQVAGLSDQAAQLTDDLSVSEHSRNELHEAIQPFAQTGQALKDFPVKGLVETNLFAAVKHPEGSGVAGWWYSPALHSVADCRNAAKYLKKA